MATTGMYKLDDGNSFVSNCFPARNLYRPVIEGVDQWERPRRAKKEKTFKTAVVSTSLEKQEFASSRLNDSTAAGAQPQGASPGKEQEAEGNVLNALFLLKSHYVDNPSDLCSVNVSDKNLTSVEEEDFEQFDSVAYINAAENLLTLAQFRRFSALRELELAMNGIRNLEVNPGDFSHLEILDLSYNNLSTDDVLALGLLPRLRVLHLTANGLTRLPSDMAVSELKNPELKRFPFLEILMLDDNKLSHPSVFSSLANLKKLKQLHLENNEICEIPYLHQMEDGLHTSNPTWVRVCTNDEGSSHSNSALHSPTTSNQQKHVLDAVDDVPMGGKQINYVVLPNKEDTDRTEVVFTGMPNLPLDSSLRKPPDMEKSFSFPDDFKTTPCKKQSPTFQPPLPELRYLSLADNKITCEENLLAVALFPSLAELVIHSNPLTTLRKGDPPLLTSLLQNRLGITLIRRKPPELSKPHIFIPVKAKRKVKTRIPKIPKQPLMLGAPPESYHWGLEFNFNWNEFMDSGKQPSSPLLSPEPLPPIKASSVEESVLNGDTQQEPSVASDSTPQGSTTDHDREREDFDSVFMTQVDDLLADDLPDSCESEDEEHKTDQHEPEKKTNVQIPDIFKGYEELYYIKPDPDFIEPVGISDNVKALEHALKHMLVHREAKPRLHSIQKPYIPKEKKIGKVVSSPLRKNKAETLEDILSSMKKAKTYTELPLGLILRNKKSDRKEYGEALMLLKEIQFRYHRAHEESSERARELEASVYK